MPSPNALAVGFLDRYVKPSGAVVRTDQGGDVVSEGQAYAMVLAEMAGRPQTVRLVWTWTHTHLQRSDGLLSWHAKSDGTVLDPQSAGDADALTAYALLHYRGTGAAAMAAAGKQIASAILAHETVQVAGQTVLAAGPWAITASPQVVDPSYWMPSVFRAIAAATQDGRWTTLADTSVQMLSALTHDGSQLPPDWAHVQGNALVPASAPGTSNPPGYGFDAQRVPVWLAVDCTQGARQLAARWWSRLDGQSASTSPLAEVATAAAADAAGKASSGKAALNAGIHAAQDHPTYYGDAWAALGSQLLAGRAPACTS